MKIKIILPLLFSVILLLGCQKKEASAPLNEGILDGEYEVLPTASASASITEQGFALAVNAGFYILSGDDTGDEKTKTKWAASISLGEKVLLGNTRQMILESDNRVYEFIEVRRLSNNTEGYVLSWQVAKDGQLAVVIGDNTNLYRTARIIDVSGVILTRRSVVVYYPQTETEGFVQVKGYDIGRKQYIAENNSFIRYDTLSRRESDIQSAILLQTALALTAERQASQREALLKSALEYFPDSIFYSEIFEVAFPDSIADSHYNYESTHNEND